jgi:hypothetical protein
VQFKKSLTLGGRGPAESGKARGFTFAACPVLQRSIPSHRRCNEARSPI